MCRSTCFSMDIKRHYNISISDFKHTQANVRFTRWWRFKSWSSGLWHRVVMWWDSNISEKMLQLRLEKSYLGPTLYLGKTGAKGYARVLNPERHVRQGHCLSVSNEALLNGPLKYRFVLPAGRDRTTSRNVIYTPFSS